MDLTWKDKLSYYSQDWRNKFPYTDNPKKQNVLLIFCGVCVIFLLIASVSLLAGSNINKKNFNNPTQVSINGSSATVKNGQTSTPSTRTSPASGNKLNGIGSVIKGSAPSKYSQIFKGAVPPPQVLFPNSVSPSLGVNNTNSYTQTGSSSTGSIQNKQNGGAGSNNTSNTNLSNVVLYFQDPNGNLQPYVAPTAPPANLSWETYVNTNDQYTIEIPVGWQMVRTLYDGHEGVSIYPQGMNTTITIQNGLVAIGFGVSQYDYQVPYINQSQASSIAPITIDGYSGSIYTQGSFGMNTVAAIIKYGNYYFGIGGTANSIDMIYIFQHMLESLHLYG